VTQEAQMTQRLWRALARCRRDAYRGAVKVLAVIEDGTAALCLFVPSGFDVAMAPNDDPTGGWERVAEPVVFVVREDLVEAAS
jgi:hypothetical protein